MPEKAAAKEFLVVALPDTVEPGTNLRLLAIDSSLKAAESTVAGLGAGALGRVAVLERKALYARRPAVESIEIEEPITG